MNFSQCPDEFQVEQQFNKVTHKTIYCDFNYEELEQKYKFNYPLHNKPQIHQKKEETLINTLQKHEAQDIVSNQQIDLPLQPSRQQVRAIQLQDYIPFCQKQNEQYRKDIKSIIKFQVDTKFMKIKPSKKKNQREQQQLTRTQIQIIQNNCKYQKSCGSTEFQSLSKDQRFLINNKISEMTFPFERESKHAKFYSLLKQAPKSLDIEQYQVVSQFGNKQLCEGMLDGKIVQFIKTEQSNVIL